MDATSSRERLLKSGKHLFATRGYENTSTMMIARAAGTSESQLMKHFGSKDGLLEAIFAEGWAGMALRFSDALKLPSPSERLRKVIDEMFAWMERDPEIKELILLESRRIRREGRTVLMTQGYVDFMRMVDGILEDMRAVGQLRSELKPEAVRSAIIGMAEGLLRDQMLARRMNLPTYSSEELRHVIETMLPGIQVKHKAAAH